MIKRGGLLGYCKSFWHEFAESCGMHRTYISAIECFRRSISLENIQRIADALGIDAYLLLVDNERTTGPDVQKED